MIINAARVGTGATVVALAAALLVPSASHATKHHQPKAPKPFTSDSIVVDKSVGGITLDSSYGALKKKFKAPGCSPDNGCSYTSADGKDSVLVQLYSKTQGGPTMVGRISMSSQDAAKSPLAEVTTSRDIGLGSSSREVKKAYPGIKGSDKSGSYYIKGHGQRLTVFYVDHRHVYEVFMQSVMFG